MKIITSKDGKKRLELSRKDWNIIGKRANWVKVSQEENKAEDIIQSIMAGRNEDFSYKHFSSSNMSDFSLMREAINDLVDAYGIDAIVAAFIIQRLTHQTPGEEDLDQEDPGQEKFEEAFPSSLRPPAVKRSPSTPIDPDLS